MQVLYGKLRTKHLEKNIFDLFVLVAGIANDGFSFVYIELAFSIRFLA